MIELGQTVHYGDVASERIELERFAPVGRAVLEPYCDIPPRTLARC